MFAPATLSQLLQNPLQMPQMITAKIQPREMCGAGALAREMSVPATLSQLLRNPLQMPQMITAKIQPDEKSRVVSHVDQKSRCNRTSLHASDREPQSDDKNYQQRPPRISQLLAVNHGKGHAGSQYR